VGSIDFKEFERQAFAAALPDLNKLFKEHATSNHGWVDELVEQIEIIDDNSNIQWSYPDAIEEEVFNSEHGEIGTPPAAAMRTYKNKIMDDIHDIVEDAIVAALFQSDVFE
jgi:hypothetical protein